MSVKSGLDALDQIMKKQQESAGGDFVKAEWFKLDDGKSARIRFLQEFDRGSKHYDAGRGSVIMAIEHTAPGNFRSKALCTIEDGRCWACEQHKVDPKPAQGSWKARPRLYANILVKTDEGNKVQILSQSVSNQSITPTLREFAIESGSITDRPWKITRNGSGTQTSYLATPFDRVDEYFDDFDDYELYDLEKVCTRQVAYEDQAAFYNGGAVQVDSGSEYEPAPKSWSGDTTPSLSGW